MITASHNPAIFNGFKLKSHFGGSAESATCQEVEKLLGKSPVRAIPLEEAVEAAMKACGEAKVKTTIGTWAFQKNPPAVNVVDATKIPAEYMKQLDPVIDRAAILEKLKAKEAVPGAELTQGESLRFR